MKKNCFYLGIPLLGMIDFRVIVIVPVVVDSLEDGDWVYHTKWDIYIYISIYIYIYIYIYLYIYIKSYDISQLFSGIFALPKSPKRSNGV